MSWVKLVIRGRIISILVLMAMSLVLGCLGSESLETTTTIIEPSTSTIKVVPTSTITTTILPVTTTTISPIVATSTIAPIVEEISCDSICDGSGYGGGYCRRTVMECRLNSEIYNRAGSRYCPRVKDNTCCCFNEGDADHKNATTHYVYNVRK